MLWEKPRLVNTDSECWYLRWYRIILDGKKCKNCNILSHDCGSAPGTILVF